MSCTPRSQALARAWTSTLDKVHLASALGPFVIICDIQHKQANVDTLKSLTESGSSCSVSAAAMGTSSLASASSASSLTSFLTSESGATSSFVLFCFRLTPAIRFIMLDALTCMSALGTFTSAAAPSASSWPSSPASSLTGSTASSELKPSPKTDVVRETTVSRSLPAKFPILFPPKKSTIHRTTQKKYPG